jgi:glycosyltransferase involved in cell wall biosynthesis
MIILTINTDDVIGGAGLAALRLAESQRKAGHRVHFMVMRKASKLNWVERIKSPKSTSALKHKIPYFINVQRGHQYSMLPLQRKHILDRVASLKPDIIQLHNVHGGDLGFFQISLLKELSEYAPVVWTLHDMWSLTGHCAYTLECNGWMTGCEKCEHLDYYPRVRRDNCSSNLRKKREFIRSGRIHGVTPSGWLAQLNVEQRTFLEGNVHHIPNGIDLDMFRPSNENRNELRRQLGISADSNVLIFSAERVEKNRRKGGEYLRGIVEELGAQIDAKYHLIVMGGGGLGFEIKADNIVLHEVGFIKNQNKVVEFLQASDLFLFTSIQDNLPNTLVEAHAVGLPAVAFRVGGVPEIVIDQETGILCDIGDVKAVAHAISDLCEDVQKATEMKVKARDHAKNHFSSQLMHKHYMSLYESLRK